MAQFLDEVGSFAPRTYAGEIRDNICNKPVESSQMILVEEKYGWMDFLPGTRLNDKHRGYESGYKRKERSEDRS
jgi:hypothetical protein